jgi:hypothetical protein
VSWRSEPLDGVGHGFGDLLELLLGMHRRDRGAAGAIDITVNTPFSMSAFQNGYTRSLEPRTIGTAGVSLSHVSRPSDFSMAR